MKITALILSAFFTSVAFAEWDVKSLSGEKGSPWLITPSATLEYSQTGKEPIWIDIKGINVGFASKENINNIKEEFEASYNTFLNTKPDIKDEEQWASTFSGAGIGSDVRMFESTCRTFIDAPKRISGSITYNTESHVPTVEVCKLIILTFLANGYKFEKSKQGRTVVLKQF